MEEPEMELVLLCFVLFILSGLSIIGFKGFIAALLLAIAIGFVVLQQYPTTHWVVVILVIFVLINMFIVGLSMKR